MTRPRVLLADDHRLLPQAFAQLLQPRCKVVGTVADGPALLEAAPELLQANYYIVKHGGVVPAIAGWRWDRH